MSAADLCRAALKLAGYSARKVTVRERSYHDVHVTIRAVGIRACDVDAVLATVCPPYEIYADGDPFMAPGFRVEYLDDIIAPIAARVAARIRAVELGHVAYAAPFARCYVDTKSTSGQEVHWLGDTFARTCWDIDNAGEQAARELLDRGYGAPVPADWLDRLDLDDPAPVEPTCAHGAALSVSCLACHAAATT